MFLVGKRVYSIATGLIFFLSSSIPALAERIDRGTQTIQGTQVQTTIYHERGYAVFSNDCGSQRLTQGQLQNGAIPSDIIPCPRPNTRVPRETPRSPSPNNGNAKWAALAAGIDEGGLFSRARVAVGSAIRHATRASAERAALEKCREAGVSGCKVVSTFSRGCGYITISKNANNVAWGMGSTKQEAYDQCYKRVEGGNCDTAVIGGCVD